MSRVPVRVLLLCVGALLAMTGAPRVIAVDPAVNPVLVGQLTIPGQHPVNDVAVQGRYAYVAYGDARYEGYGLRVVDVLNPSRPVLIGGYNLHPPGVTGQVPAIDVAGAYVYLAAGGEGLRIIDVSNPAAPRPVGVYQPPLGYVSDVEVAGGYAYVAAGGGGLRIVDVSDPAAPREVGHRDGCCTTLLTVVGTTIYTAEATTFQIVDAADPRAPVLVGSLEMDLIYLVQDVAVSGTIAYVSTRYCLRLCDGRLFSVDIADRANPRVVSSYGAALPVQAFDTVAAFGPYVLVNNAGILSVIDASNPAAPTQIGSYPFGTGPSGIDPVNGLIYATDNTQNTYAARLTILRFPFALPTRAYLPAGLR